jgi:hypothetical protein
VLAPRISATALLVLAATFVAAPVLRDPAVAQDRSEKEKERDKEKFRREIAVWEPFKRKAVRGSLVTLQFRLRRGWFAPVLVVIYPDGTPTYTRAETTAGATMWEVTFRTDKRGGRHRVSLVVDSATGDAMAAQFLVHATDADGELVERDLDLPDPNTEYPSLDPAEHPLRLERHLFHRMNAFRRKNDLKPLPWHEGVARAARDHMPTMAQHYENTFDRRKGYGKLKHRVPGAGLDGAIGPDIAQRVEDTLGWPQVIPKLPPANPRREERAPNYISEILTSGASSLDFKFEQTLLRKSDLRAPLLGEWTTHAAGAATWRLYRKTGRNVLEKRNTPGNDPGDRPVASDPENVTSDEAAPGSGKPPRGELRQCLTTLVFIQINDPMVHAFDRQEEKTVFKRLSRARGTTEKAAALRLVGQHAYRKSTKTLLKALKNKKAEIVAAALDGLWLCAPDEARAATDAMRVRVVLGFASGNFSRCSRDLLALSEVRYDAASRREGQSSLEKVRVQARKALDSADLRIMKSAWAEAAEALEDVKKRFDGLAEGEEAALALKQLRKNPAAKEVLDAR